jgi:hypothetical protein
MEALEGVATLAQQEAREAKAIAAEARDFAASVDGYIRYLAALGKIPLPPAETPAPEYGTLRVLPGGAS